MASVNSLVLVSLLATFRASSVEVSPSTLAVDETCSTSEADCGLNVLQHSAVNLHTMVADKSESELVQPTRTRASQVPKDKPNYGFVEELYTYGAPATCRTAFRNLQSKDGTFTGLRLWTEDIWGANGESKWVDAAALFNTLDHALMPALILRSKQTSDLLPSSPSQSKLPKPEAAAYAHWPIHSSKNYVERLATVSLNNNNAAEVTAIQRATLFAPLNFHSYLKTTDFKDGVAKFLPGWKLVAHELLVTGRNALRDEDPVWLVQEQGQGTLECALVFTGTNNKGNEYSTSITLERASYCGYSAVHKGYRDELSSMTKYLWPSLTPKLALCSKVSVVGHSLGGAVAEIFAACENSGRTTNPDFLQQSWTRAAAPQALPEWGDEPHTVENDFMPGAAA